MAHGFLQIGEVADRAGLSLRTVRYYEEQGLVTPAKRSDGGFRLYTEQQVDRLLVIKQMKPLGFTVQEMRELIDARDAASSGNEAAKVLLATFAADTRARCAKLTDALERGAELAALLDVESAD